MLLTSAEMKALEERAFAEGADASSLMEEAGAKMAGAVRQFFPRPGHCIVHFGKGHNGGDALVAARYLAKWGWGIELRGAFLEEEWSELTRRQWEALDGCINRASEGAGNGPVIVLDGLLGIGAGGALREPLKGACREINRLRREENAWVFALDLPTGLSGDDGAFDENAVEADFTLTVGFAKRGLLADEAMRLVGRLVILPLDALSAFAPGNGGDEVVATAASLSGLIPRRPFDLHKGRCGRVGIVAGSVGLTGAAALCAEGALRGGAGLVTLYVTRDVYPIVAGKVSAAVMVRPVDSLAEVLEEKLDVLAIGPGLGLTRVEEILDVIERATAPVVVDADALNALALKPDLLLEARGPRLLTPHPGEMERLWGESGNRSRLETVREFTRRHGVTLLLKGSRSAVGESGRAVSYNSTGNPGLASGGVGDVITGLLGALVGQGLGLYDAARVGSWIIGRCAERLVFGGGRSGESLAATDLPGEFGGAFEDLRSGVW